MKPKIAPLRIAADDCKVWLGRVIRDGAVVDPGTSYPIHEGEWVELMPVQTVRELLALERLRLTTDAADSLQELCQELSHRILAWNWTDLTGEPMPAPHGNPAAIEALTPDELLWLLSQLHGGENQEIRKNGLAPSVATS